MPIDPTALVGRAHDVLTTHISNVNAVDDTRKQIADLQAMLPDLEEDVNTSRKLVQEVYDEILALGANAPTTDHLEI